MEKERERERIGMVKNSFLWLSVMITIIVLNDLLNYRLHTASRRKYLGACFTT